MKRFFFVFSIIMTIFLAVTAGSIAAVERGSIKPNSTLLHFFAKWGITLIPYYGSTILFPMGDVFLIEQTPIDDVKPGSIVLYEDNGNSGIKSGRADARTTGGYSIETTGGVMDDVPASNIFGMYKLRLPGMANILGAVRSPLAIGIFAAVLIASIVLWKALPGGRALGSHGLSETDEDIASILY